MRATFERLTWWIYPWCRMVWLTSRDFEGLVHCSTNQDGRIRKVTEPEEAVLRIAGLQALGGLPP